MAAGGVFIVAARLRLLTALAVRHVGSCKGSSASTGGGGASLAARNTFVALGLAGFVGSVYGFTIYRMKVNDELDELD